MEQLVEKNKGGIRETSVEVHRKSRAKLRVNMIHMRDNGKIGMFQRKIIIYRKMVGECKIL